MFQVRFHGRGGQGVVTAAGLLASAAFREDRHAKGWQVPVDAAPTGKRVLVVGAGPSGLSAAYHLTRDYCKGCGLCAAECPCGAIEMEPEPS